jgi:RES domain-containing protein
MRLGRICRKSFAKDPLSGTGGLFASGRWHIHPRPVIYASESLALANLEFLVHLQEGDLPRDPLALEFDVPEDILVASLEVSELPRSWRRIPPPRAIQELGNSWLNGNSSAVLRVPSTIIPSEFNFLINPLHPDCERITVVSKTNFTLDRRLIVPRQGDR